MAFKDPLSAFVNITESVVTWVCSMAILVPLFLTLGYFKKNKSSTFAQCLSYLIPAYRLDLTHPMTIHLGGASFFFGLTMLLSSISTSFSSFNDEKSCNVFIRASVTCEILAHLNLTLILICRADAALTNSELTLRRFLEFFFRPFVFLFSLTLVILSSMDAFFKPQLQTVDAGSGTTTTVCFLSFSVEFVSLFIIGDAFLSIGLFLLFYIPLRRVIIKNQEALMLSSHQDEDDALDQVVIRNFKSFLFVWAGNTSLVLIIWISSLLLHFNFAAGLGFYALIMIPLILFAIGLWMMYWKTLDFEGTIFQRFVAKPMDANQALLSTMKDDTL
jgi:hypothetical protein